MEETITPARAMPQTAESEANPADAH